MKALLNDRQGATSVLVIFMMIVLVVFATLAFTTSYANYRLSQKAAVITRENYALDALAMRMTLKVDTCLANAETRAQQAIVSEGVAQGRIQGLSMAQGEDVRQRLSSDTSFMSELMNRLYLQYALEELTPLDEEFAGFTVVLGGGYSDGSFLSLDRPAPADDAIAVTLALTTGSEKGDKQLDIVLAVKPLEYELMRNGDQVSGARAESFTLRYRIDAWKQWQIPHEYDDSLEFGDARIIIEDLE